MWALPFLRLVQHFLGVGMNTAYLNLAYINIPSSDQTNYVAFNTVCANIATFLGMLCGTSFIAAYPNISVSIAGLDFINVQMLMWVQAFGQLFVPLLLLMMLPKMQPDSEFDR